MSKGEQRDDRAHLVEMINACWTTQAIGTAVELGLPALLAEAPQRAGSLAHACGCHAPSLRRVLRSLASLGVVDERDDGSFALTPRGELLLPDAADSLAAWARLRCAQWPAWGELVLTVKSGKGRRVRESGHDDFRHLDGNGSGAALFHRAIAALTATAAATSPLLAQLALRDRDRVVVDVGGGSGRLLAAILLAAPRLEGIVFDLEHARAAALEHLASHGLASRGTFVAGSFFDSVPAGDVYLLKSVLHNWDDARCETILERCRAAMHAGARLFVVERIAPERMSDVPAHRAIAASDLNMLVGLSGRERTEAELRGLLEAAALRVSRVVAGDGEFALIEAIAG